MKHISRDTARGIIVRDGQMLVFERWRRNLLGQTQHYFSIPGGEIEKNEAPENAVVRELKEEMSVEVKVKKLLYVQETARGKYSYFLCSLIAGEPVFNLDSEEAYRSLMLNRYKVAWLSLEEVLENPFPPDYKDALTIILPKL